MLGIARENIQPRSEENLIEYLANEMCDYLSIS